MNTNTNLLADRAYYVSTVGDRWTSGAAVKVTGLENAIRIAKHFSLDAFHSDVHDCTESNSGVLVGRAIRGEWRPASNGIGEAIRSA